MPIALLSVSDKTGVVEFARGLREREWTIVSTGGTADQLKDADIPVTPVGELTGFPELLAGRVKTLHPVVHAGILARRTVPEDMEALAARDIRPIDLVAVNLYPFRQTIARESATLAEALEQIDIGGPTLLRAAAKNHPFVWAVCDWEDYGRVLEAIDRDEDDSDLRRWLAAKVFRHAATYDAGIAGYLGAVGGGAHEGTPELPAELLAPLVRVQSLRYGENPDQRAAFYREASGRPWGIPGLRQLHGKKLSYNNLLDLDGALAALAPFRDSERPACAILKHTTPCGISTGRSALDAYQKALACDPVSAFGSVVAFTQPVTESLAESLALNFIECLVAPGYADAALRVLQQRKNLRILAPESSERLSALSGHLWPGLQARGVLGGLLVQSAPRPANSGRLQEDPHASVPTKREPTEREWLDLDFAWAAVQSVKSNGILLARDGSSVGIGAGQMSRVDSVRLAVEKACGAGQDLSEAVLASDAFFPFRDGIDVGAEAGIRAVVQPGGSIRDAEVIAAADEHDMAMVFTGRRLFRH
ncbi:MAG: bifunctional phosphoribosylaminoimidazolecarboxamide formyltransferase/IMP cyclohydrolase [Gemmatimonadota bacterium]